MFDDTPRTVTFDCWSTLLYEAEPGASHSRRVRAVESIASRGGRMVSEAEARRSLDAAWHRHVELWQEGEPSGAPEIARWSLDALRVESSDAAQDLAQALSESALASDVQVIEGACETLEGLAGAGVRLALICDTGFSPGHIVRRLLEREGLLQHLEVQVFSDEVGVPKPHPRAFETALRGLGSRPEDAVHVGDLRRTDVAGGRGAGMRTIRIRAHHDDASELPDADRVADSYAQMRRILGLV